MGKETTIKDAIIKSLEDLQQPSSYMEVYEQIMKESYYPHFETKDTPENTVSAQLGDFIRKSDNRVKRIKLPSGIYGYYLTSNEEAIGLDVLTGTSASSLVKPTTQKKKYEERDLHKLLSTFLKSHGINSKTIFHEKSSSKKDKNQKWIHPDMVGIAFLKLQNRSSQAL